MNGKRSSETVSSVPKRLKIDENDTLYFQDEPPVESDKLALGVPLTPPAETPSSKSNEDFSIFKPTTGTHRISMGFMAQCEQCQKGVRGHYVHWIPNDP